MLDAPGTFQRKDPRNSLLLYLNQHIPRTQSDGGAGALTKEVRGQLHAREQSFPPVAWEGNAGEEMAPL